MTATSSARATPCSKTSQRSGRSGTWGDHSVRSCRSCTRAEGPGTSAGAFPMALSLSGEDSRGPRRDAKGSCGTPGPLNLRVINLRVINLSDLLYRHKAIGSARFCRDDRADRHNRGSVYHCLFIGVSVNVSYQPGAARWRTPIRSRSK